nr:squalene/phytoene synthase family protein [Gemmatimonadales bacterium]
MTAHAVVERAAAARPGEPGRAWPQAVSEGRALLARKARSFHLATALLPVPVQDDVAVLYGFCRLADDLADEPRSRAG